MMKPVPSGIEYVYPPVAYPDGRRSVCKIPPGYVQPALSKSDYQDLSDEYDLEIALVKAVMDVESAGSGFLLKEPAPARPKILFEAQWFYKLTPKPVSKSRPDLSSPVWDRDLYKGGSAEWDDRLLDAMEFDEVQALKSASFGLGQLMGFNYPATGCTSIQQFIQENFAGEYWQARHMMNFIVKRDLLGHLKNKAWDKFAFGYNGEFYWKNGYGIKLADAYNKALIA
jgi:hypothetical protein